MNRAAKSSEPTPGDAPLNRGAPLAMAASSPSPSSPSPRAAPTAARTSTKARGPAPLVGSEPARRQAAAILEVLAGVRRPSEAAQALSTSLPRYYQLERRALLGLLKACEPAPRGPRIDLTRQLAALERENRRLKRECDRQQALVRMAERGLGLPPPASVVKVSAAKESAMKGTAKKSAGSAASGESSGTATKKRRARRASVRALTMIRSLAAEVPESSLESSSSLPECSGTISATAVCETCG